MNTPIKLTVSLVTFRTDLAILTATIASLKASSVPLEAVIIDNTPEDAYFEQLRRIQGVRLVRSPRNGGYGFGHNHALNHTSPDIPYHLILNPDVVIHPGCLETLIAVLEEKPEVGVAMPRILNKNGTLQYLNKRDPTVLDLALRRFLPGPVRALPFIKRRMDYYVRMDYGYDAPSDIPYASGCFMLFRRSVLDALQGFDERFFMHFEDADLSRRARAIARILFVPEAIITHYWARGSHHSWQLLFCTLSSARRYFNKWGWKWW